MDDEGVPPAHEAKVGRRESDQRHVGFAPDLEVRVIWIEDRVRQREGG